MDDVRERLLSAATELLAREGLDAVSIDALCRASGCSRGTFDAAFSDRADCLAALFDTLARRMWKDMLAACGRHEHWIDAVRAALTELLHGLDANANAARFVVVDSAVGAPALHARRAHALACLAGRLGVGRPAAPDLLPAPFGAEAVVGTVAAVLHGRIAADPAPRLSELRGPLMGVIVMPYLGVEAARAELMRGSGGPRRRR